MAAQTTVQIPEAIQKELTNLRGFRDLLTERTCYMLGRKEQQKKMNTATKKERETANDIRKVIKKGVPQWIAKSNVKEYEKQIKALTDASAAVSKKTKPFRDKIAPLTRAIKFVDTVAVPASLTLLGVKLQPTFSLTKFMKAEIEKQKKNN